MQRSNVMQSVDRVLRSFALPLIGIAAFLVFWHFTSSGVDTSLGKFPGPATVLEQAEGLVQEYRDERQRKADFYARQDARNARLKAKNPDAQIQVRPYSGAPTYLEQIATSLRTVFTGFLFAAAIAIPFGIVIGLSGDVYKAMNPII